MDKELQSILMMTQDELYDYVLQCVQTQAQDRFEINVTKSRARLHLFYYNICIMDER